MSIAYSLFILLDAVFAPNVSATAEPSLIAIDDDDDDDDDDEDEDEDERVGDAMLDMSSA
jgi:hypothetical protein